MTSKIGGKLANQWNFSNTNTKLNKLDLNICVLKKNSLVSRDENMKSENRYEDNFTTLSPLWDK